MPQALSKLESDHTANHQSDATHSNTTATSLYDDVWNGAGSAWNTATAPFRYAADAVADLILPKYDVSGIVPFPALPGPFDKHEPVEPYTPPSTNAAKVEEPAPPHKHEYEEPKIYNVCTNVPMLSYELPGVCF